MKITTASEARAAIAWLVHGDAGPGERLGAVTLHTHQRDGVDRCRKLLRERGGALLADDVGLGKTFVALAVARDARQPWVIAPAALREAWTTSARQAGIAIHFVSVEMLGRRPPSSGRADLVIIDEAHHLRSARTRRFAAASALCKSANVLLLTATPVQNRLGDLRNILSLFLGERAHGMTADELSLHVVRRTGSDVPAAPLGLPEVRVKDWVRFVGDVDCLDRLLALPPCVPPADGDDGGALLSYTLARQWASSRAALRAALERRLARARALEDALLTGRHPSRAELAAWCFADGAQQLAFPELMVSREIGNGDALVEQVRRHALAVRELVAWLETSPNPDRERVSALSAIMREHPDERVVAFSEYTETVAALYKVLAPRERVAMLTHAGGRVASGPLSRREVLKRFAPGSSARAPACERIDLLLTTDVLSEGVNLQDASVVVHLDLCWNPARLEQRVGRLRRIGAARKVVTVCTFAPPSSAERLLQLERRLRVKLGVAARSVGLAGTILPGFPAPSPNASAAREERIVAAMRAWRTGDGSFEEPVAGAARSNREGALACVECDGTIVLLAVDAGQVTDSRSAVESLVTSEIGETLPLATTEVARLRQEVERWLLGRAVSNLVDLPALRVAHSRRALLRRVDTIARRAPRHSQSALAPLMRAARTAAAATLSAGAERVLDQLAHATLSDSAWLHAIGEFAAIHARDRTAAPPQILALLILRRPA